MIMNTKCSWSVKHLRRWRIVLRLTITSFSQLVGLRLVGRWSELEAGGCWRNSVGSVAAGGADCFFQEHYCAFLYTALGRRGRSSPNSCWLATPKMNLILWTHTYPWYEISKRLREYNNLYQTPHPPLSISLCLSLSFFPSLSLSSGYRYQNELIFKF